MRLDKLTGILPPVPTPFDACGDLALDRLRENLAWWLERPLAGIVALGSNGEAVHLDDDERRAVVECIRTRVPDHLPVIAGTGVLSTRRTIALTQSAASAGASAVLVLPPHYYRTRMTDEALVAHYEAVADAAAVPVLLYNMPACTGIDLGPELIARLSEHKNIAGLKDSSGNVAKLGLLREAVAPEFRLLAGSAGFLLPALSIGADGGVLALANIAPAECVSIHRAFTEGDAAGAARLQTRVVALNAAVTARWGVAGLKHAMDRIGLYGGPVRGPLRPLSPTEAATIDGLLRRGGLLPAS